MNNKSRFSRSALSVLQQAGVALFAALVLIAAPVAGNAQETTTTIRGTVSAPDGSPAAGETVTVTDTRTNRTRTVTTNSSGGFDVAGLPVGGPYTIRVQSSRYQGTLVTDV